MELSTKIEILIRDFGLETILEQNDILEEEALAILIETGLVNLEEYFYVDTDEEIWKDEE